MDYTCKAFMVGGERCGHKAKFKFGSGGGREGHDVCGVHKNYHGQLASGYCQPVVSSSSESGDGSSGGLLLGALALASAAPWALGAAAAGAAAVWALSSSDSSDSSASLDFPAPVFTAPTTRELVNSAAPAAPVAPATQELVTGFGHGSPATPQMVEAAEASQASLMHSINICVGEVRCHSQISGCTQTNSISDVFFPDATLEVSHPNAKITVPASGTHTVFVDLLKVRNMHIQFDLMECRVSSDERGPCLDMWIGGRYSENGSVPRPLNVLTRQREHLCSGKLRTAKMRITCE